MTTGGAKLDSPTNTGEIYSSTLGLLVPGTSGLQIVVSGHAVGDVGSPIVLADGTQIGRVSHNSYLRGPVSGGKTAPGVPNRVGNHPDPGQSSLDESEPLPPPFNPAGPDVAAGSWNSSVLGLPLTVSLATGSVSVPLPITGAMPPAVGLPIQVFGAGAGLRLGVITQVNATVTDADTQATVQQVAVARYASSLTDSGAPIVTISPETFLPVIVGFHGGRVKEPPASGPPLPDAGPTSWFVPWTSAQQALGLPPLPV